MSRPADPRYKAYAKKYGRSVNNHHFTRAILDQLHNCADEEARRILLGVSK